MLDGVDFGGVHHRFVVGLGDPKIKGGDGLGTDSVHPGDIKTGLQAQMIDGKAGDFFHKTGSSQIFFYILSQSISKSKGSRQGAEKDS